MAIIAIPIGTVPGLVSVLTGVDLTIAMPGVAGTVNRLFLRHTDFDNGGATDTSVSGSLRNAPAGGGQGLSFTIPDQTQSYDRIGPLTFADTDTLYLRVDVSGASMNLTGWIEIETGGAPAPVTVGLTNLVNVKAQLGITVSTHDVLLQALIDAVSAEIQAWLRRPIAVFTETEEKGDIWGSDEFYLNRFPLMSVTSCTENGQLLTDGVDFEHTESDDRVGRLVRLSGEYPITWASGNRNIVTTYEHGYLSIPPQVTQAANELVAFDWYNTRPGGARLGLDGKALDTGGTSGFTTRNALWTAQTQRLTPFTRKD